MLNKRITKHICTLSIVCCMVISPVFAQEDNAEKQLIKAVKETKAKIVTEEHVNKVYHLTREQMSKREQKDALKTVDYLIEINKELYGEKSLNHIYANMLEAGIATGATSPLEAFEALKKVEQLAVNFPEDTELKKNILNTYENLYSYLEQPTLALKYANETEKDPIQKKLKTARYLNQASNTKEAIKIYTELEKTATKTKNSALLCNVYEDFARLYSEQKNYKKMNEYVAKLEKLKTDNPNIENTLTDIKLGYLKDTSQREEAKKLAEKLYANKSKFEYYNALYDIEKDLKNIDVAKEYLKHIADFYIENHEKDSLEISRNVYEKYFDLNKDLEKIGKAEKYLEKIAETIEPLKDIAPIAYSKYLSKAAGFKSHTQDFTGAKDNLIKAIAIYEEYEPTSSQLFDFYKDYAQAELHSGNPDEALIYLNKALAHKKKYVGAHNEGIASIYESLADVYSHLENTVEEEKYIDKSIALFKDLYGENSIKTLEKEFKKYNFYQKTEQQKLAENLLDKVNVAITSGKAIGEEKDFSFTLAMTNADNAIQKGEIDKALTFLDEAKTFAYDKNKKQEIKDRKKQIKDIQD